MIPSFILILLNYFSYILHSSLHHVFRLEFMVINVLFTSYTNFLLVSVACALCWGFKYAY